NIRNDQRIDHIPVILLTAKTSLQDRISGIEEGIDVYLSKPFEEEELLAHIKNLIAQRNRLKEKYQETEDSQKLNPQASRNQKYLQHLRAIVNQHLDDTGFGVEELAKQVHLSSRQLGRKLRAISDLTANQLIRTVRVETSKELLKKGGKTISEISLEVGFSSPQYFATVFKEEVGMSPGEFIEH
ncbi:MAG: helix-turn-helix domain-containing protein, partial [Saprospiraceae bacterium]|nr:helix-turn-helix domain-containing protein [Saprospiraceae bacterium]